MSNYYISLFLSRYKFGTWLAKILEFIATGLLSVLLTIINFYWGHYEGDVEDLYTWGCWFSAFGTCFAIVSGLVLAKVMDRFTTLQTVLEDEMNAVEACRDTLVHLDLKPEQETAFHQAILAYLEAVADVEWLNMMAGCEEGGSPLRTNQSPELIVLNKHVAHLRKELNGDPYADTIISSILIPRIMQIGDLRTRRLALSGAVLPPMLRILMSFMIAIIMLAMVLCRVQNLMINMYMTITLLTSFQWLNSLITDLDHPWFGVWNVQKAPLDLLISKFRASVKNETLVPPTKSSVYASLRTNNRAIVSIMAQDSSDRSALTQAQENNVLDSR